MKAVRFSKAFREKDAYRNGIKHFYLIIALILSTSCVQEQKDPSVSKLEAKVSSLEKRLDYVADTAAIRDLKISDLQSGFKIGYFTPQSRGFSRVDSDTGTFLVSLDNLRPYANGFKATFRIGNPSLATFSNVVLNTEWGRSSAPPSARHSNKQTLLQPIRAGAWNHVTVVLAPTYKDDIESISVSLETPMVSLRE